MPRFAAAGAAGLGSGFLVAATFAADGLPRPGFAAARAGRACGFLRAGAAAVAVTRREESSKARTRMMK